jgi:imidazolonepropionase-like amidohydrolase
MKKRSFYGMIAIAAALAGPALGQTTLIRNARIHTMAGAGAGAGGAMQVIAEGDILMRDGVIAAVGADIPAPDGANILDAKGRVATPGIFAPWSQIGLEEIGLDDEANDSSPEGDFPLSAALDAADAFNPAASMIAINRAGGVTRAIVAPAAGSKMFGGRAAIVDLSGRAESLTRARMAQSVMLGEAGAGRNGGTRMGAWASLREYLDEARRYGANPDAYAARPIDPKFALADLKALVPAARGQEPLIVAVNRASELRALIRLKADYGLNVVALGAAEGHIVAKELAAANIPVIINPMRNLPGQFESLGATLANARKLHEAGAVVAFYDPPSGSHNLRLLPQLAGNAAANGMPYEAALAAITLNPAIIYGVASQFGSIEPGKVADVVLWDGDPLEVSSRPLAVFIDGQRVSLRNRQTLLRDRYRNLAPNDLPFAYRGAPKSP